MMYLESVAGFALLFIGGEFLVRGAVGIARRLGISPLAIGLTVVALGTSAPELIVSLDAARAGQPDLALGNVVGSCIANMALILGLASMVRPVRVDRADIRPDTLAMLAAFGVLAVLTRAPVIGRPAGLLMVCLLVAYLIWSYVRERAAMADRATEAARSRWDSSAPDLACELALEELAADARSETLANAALERCEDWRVEEVREVPTGRLPLAVAMVVAGLISLVAGANLLVSGATAIATYVGVPAAIIGLTVVALGTSLPELTTSVIATLRQHGDVAVGNVMGSNVFNVFGILGVTAIVAPVAVAPRIAEIDIPMMLVAGAAASALLLLRGRIGRFEGAIILAGYLTYVGFLYGT